MRALTAPLQLFACLVSSCFSVFEKKTPHRYLWRHLEHPELTGGLVAKKLLGKILASRSVTGSFLSIYSPKVY